MEKIQRETAHIEGWCRRAVARSVCGQGRGWVASGRLEVPLDLRVRWTDRERWRSWVAGTATSPLMAWIDAVRVKSMPHGKDTAILDSADDIGAIPLFSVMFGGVEVSRFEIRHGAKHSGWMGGSPQQAL